MNTQEQLVALVTGAASGLGRAIARDLASRNVALVLLDRDGDSLRKAVNELHTGTNAVEAIVSDITDDESIARAVAQALAKFGGIDMLIHSAGSIKLGSVEDAPVEELDTQYRVNVRAPYVLTQQLLPSLRIRKGQIVFVNSTMGTGTKAGSSQYCATKHALRALADCLRQEVNAQDIRVLSVYPGKMATPMQEVLAAQSGKEFRPETMMKPEDVAATITHALCTPRTAEITDIYIRPMNSGL